MLFEQANTWQELQDFMNVTGLKKYWISDKCGIPHSVLYSFCSGCRAMPKEYEARLISFMKEYREHNAALLSAT